MKRFSDPEPCKKCSGEMTYTLAENLPFYHGICNACKTETSGLYYDTNGYIGVVGEDRPEATGYSVIGSYTEAAGDSPPVIEREYFGQGTIFKDEEAFCNHYDKPCYVPELSDTAYTKQDFINVCGGREDFAEICFDIVDWQHPETWVEEQFVNGEWDECPKCKYFYSRYGNLKPCEKCGGPLDYETGSVSRDGVVKVISAVLRQIIETREPHGLFYAVEKGTYTGVDNKNGLAWTEAFKSLRGCKRWLLNPHLMTGGDLE